MSFTWCINGFLTNDLLSEKKKKVITFSFRIVGKHTASNRRVRIRKRGAPLTHALEKFLEGLFYFPWTDFVVNQENRSTPISAQ